MCTHLDANHSVFHLIYRHLFLVFPCVSTIVSIYFYHMPYSFIYSYTHKHCISPFRIVRPLTRQLAC